MPRCKGRTKKRAFIDNISLNGQFSMRECSGLLLVSQPQPSDCRLFSHLVSTRCNDVRATSRTHRLLWETGCLPCLLPKLCIWKRKCVWHVLQPWQHLKNKTTNKQTKPPQQTADGVLTRREHSPPHSQADLSVASGGVHQVYYIFVRFPSNHIFIHRNELVPGSEPPIALSGSVLYYGANNNLFKDNQY